MTDPVQSRGTGLQRQLSEFLYGETLHTLGTYQFACEKLQALSDDLKPVEELMGKDEEVAKSEGRLFTGEVALVKAVRQAYDCNDSLRNNLHRPKGRRRPSPFTDEEQEKREFAPDSDLLKAITRFYQDAEVALNFFLEDPMAAGSPRAPGATLGSKLAFIHDRQRRGASTDPPPPVLVEGKIKRTQARLNAIRNVLGEPEVEGGALPADDEQRISRFHGVLNSHAGAEQDLMPTIIRAFSEAHIWMHQAESLRAQSFGPALETIPETYSEVQRMLRYSLALNTFVFVMAGATPWIFAEDDTERGDVLGDYENCCDRLAPTYCMWISTQFSLLALHRRAFTAWTMGKHDDAYRDFHKLTRLLRGLRKPAQKRGLRVPGTNTFIEGMTAMSELHIGRIYRGQHAYRMALRYFERSSRHLKGWEEDSEIGQLIKSSHWRINLFLNEGKANFELGRHKRSLLYYARAWRAFLQLVQSETHAAANLEVVEDLIEWLIPIVDDPELSRRELRDRIEPLVEQLVTLRTPIHLRLLAADIVLRIGHLLFILRPPYRASEVSLSSGHRQRPHHLAWECIEQALFLDPTSTLAAGDRLKIQEARRELEAVEERAEDDVAEQDDPPKGIGDSHSREIETRLPDQWPSGSGMFEDAARVTELTLQRWLTSATHGEGSFPVGIEDQPGDQRVARGLLGSFLAHTDSSNMKLAQVYGYLMRDHGPKPRVKGREYSLDFVCLRRYSSFFPFLPRPAAFRAPGGGYFVEVSEPRKRPYGIAIDPGPDFIENLYACGHSIGDIHMIILTHDHADHIASVDALLALMGTRRGLGDPTFDQDKNRCLAIVGNESVRRRYAFYGRPHPVKRDPETGKRRPRGDAVRVLSFKKIAELTARDEGRQEAIEKAEIVLDPRRLRIEPIETWGHTDANGYVSQGFVLRFGPPGNEASILFTSDTGKPDPPAPDSQPGTASSRLFAGGKSFWKAVGEADVVVAHVSAVPLRELRELANLGPGDEVAARMIAEYLDLWYATAAQADKSKNLSEDEKAGAEQAEFLLNQLQFGFRSRPRKRGQDLRISPFTPVGDIREQPEQHLYLTGLIKVAEEMVKNRDRAPLLLIGELREELGTFRTQIAKRVRETFFDEQGSEHRPSALTSDIGLRVRLSRSMEGPAGPARVLCTTCDLDNDLVPSERYHGPGEIHELCVKGEDEGVFYNCSLHDPRRQDADFWIESVERYDVFGD
jgi:tetratricopeptide (TPR) repeat protein